jgi:CheY-like chemotaxis protein
MRDRLGQLKVTLNRVEVDEAQARIQRGLRPGGYVRLSIADTGHGMDENTLARIFEPFFTTKGPGEGTGLGLSVVHGIMENHDGAIIVDSRLGVGTVFELYFPEYAGTMSASPEVDDRLPRGSGESVLLIDDEKPLGEAMRNTLQRLGYRVTAITDPIDALNRFQTAPQAFDLLVTDQTMPHMTGLDVIQAVHHIRKDLPVVLVSGLSGQWTRDKLRGFNIGELVAKPLDFAGLAQAVRRTLDCSRNQAT